MLMLLSVLYRGCGAEVAGLLLTEGPAALFT
jgi:hypothetical protein